MASCKETSAMAISFFLWTPLFFFFPAAAQALQAQQQKQLSIISKWSLESVFAQSTRLRTLQQLDEHLIFTWQAGLGGQKWKRRYFLVYLCCQPFLSLFLKRTENIVEIVIVVIIIQEGVVKNWKHGKTTNCFCKCFCQWKKCFHQLNFIFEG